MTGTMRHETPRRFLALRHQGVDAGNKSLKHRIALWSRLFCALLETRVRAR